MDFYNSQNCPHVENKTIGEVFNDGKGGGVDINKLDDLMMSQEIKTIHQNGITFLKSDYYNQDLYGLRERVIIKYSLLDLTKIKVYTLNNEFLCTAERVMSVHPMAKYFGDITDMESLKQNIKRQKTLEKKTIKEIKNYLKTEQIKPLDWQNETSTLLVNKNIKKEVTFAEIGTNQEIIEENLDIRPNFERNYERYEWHLKNGFLNDKDVIWFKEFELTDEYKQIFGKEENESKIC
jgi:putative transposase